jgi:hypothetical protein
VCVLVQCTGVLEHYYGVFGKLLGAGAAGAFARGAGLQVFVALVLYRISQDKPVLIYSERVHIYKQLVLVLITSTTSPNLPVIHPKNSKLVESEYPSTVQLSL